MKKVIKGSSVFFYNELEEELMYLDHSTDECIWFFNSEKLIKITKDMELYDLLNNLFQNQYRFIQDELQGYQDENNLVWYSDCYYNPDDEWSKAAVSCLNIKKEKDYFLIWPTKKLDEMIERKNKTYCICFSPAGNGKYTRNVNTGLTFQDDFVQMVYQALMEKNKILVK